MSKLTDFYAHKASLQKEGKPIDPQWEHLEKQLLQEEVLPELTEQQRTVLSKVKSPLMFSGSYDPNGCLSITFTRCCMQVSTLQAKQETASGAIVTEESEPLSVAEDESLSDFDATPTEPRITKAKSIGFSVVFRDGTTYHEKKAVDTWILALKKIGLENIWITK